MKHLLSIATIGALLLFTVLLLRNCRPSESVVAVPSSSSAPMPPAEGQPPVAKPLGGNPAPPASSTVLPVAAASIVPGPTTPDRMQLFDVAFDARGVRLRGSSSAAGRVKAPPISISPWRVEFVVTGRAGQTLFAGSVDHPLHPRHEYPVDSTTGRLRTVFGLETEGALVVRVPADLPATRIAFFERRPTLAPDDPPIPLGEISLVP